MEFNILTANRTDLDKVKQLELIKTREDEFFVSLVLPLCYDNSNIDVAVKVKLLSLVYRFVYATLVNLEDENKIYKVAADSEMSVYYAQSEYGKRLASEHEVETCASNLTEEIVYPIGKEEHDMLCMYAWAVSGRAFWLGKALGDRIYIDYTKRDAIMEFILKYANELAKMISYLEDNKIGFEAQRSAIRKYKRKNKVKYPEHCEDELKERFSIDQVPMLIDMITKKLKQTGYRDERFDEITRKVWGMHPDTKFKYLTVMQKVQLRKYLEELEMLWESVKDSPSFVLEVSGGNKATADKCNAILDYALNNIGKLSSKMELAVKISNTLKERGYRASEKQMACLDRAIEEIMESTNNKKAEQLSIDDIEVEQKEADLFGMYGNIFEDEELNAKLTKLL